MSSRPCSSPLKLVAALLLAGGLAPRARASNYALEEIPRAIPATEAAKLKTAGISTTDELLARAAEAKGRKALAQKTKIAEATIKAWTQMADLLRIRGIGPDVAGLLAAAGVHTVADLTRADPARLNEAILSANDKHRLSENPPSVEHLTAWIAQAQTLPIVLK